MKYGVAARMLPGSGIRKMFTLAAQMSDVCNLSVGQPDFPTPPHIVEAYVEALRAGETRYTMDQGHPALLEALSAFLSQRYGYPVTPEHLLICCGGCEAFYVAMRALLDPGDEVILFEPAFVLFKPVVEVCGATPVILPTTADDGYLPDLDRVAASITDRTAAIVVNSPGNPTGAVYPPEFLSGLLELARSRGIWLVSDDVYERIILDGDAPSTPMLAGSPSGLISLGSFSKTYSMAGMRIGWLMAEPEAVQMARKVHMYTSNVENTAGQIAAATALTGDQTSLGVAVAEYRRRRDRLVELVASAPLLTGYSPQGAFYLSPALPARVDASDLCLRMLQDTGVCTVPGVTFGESCANTFRIAYSVGLETLEEAFRRITPWLAQQSF